ncbi:Pyruvate-flavodoxin oxidoreductase [Carpediemonas membranifera]|uniref:pyruvate dehydrogenase (NADP(+)) n=1 Tax=Carpediemonas membranifera TaxID=201153 RepID=A0A8J6B835_9EUKA|nr:Pyruvate-flavodoxin oxidoreductase [Carpediemonas membranifera]|eukprot:KAG9394682.1 Pyruvate-flavodoxin oxidoreductase [Carpediemonas membranifera]
MTCRDFRLKPPGLKETSSMAHQITCDGNEAVARIAHFLSDSIILFPITPSTPMGELSDVFNVQGKKNIFEQPVAIHQMQSEAGVSGAVHGALFGGALTTTFTTSQGLLLMIPNMYKIAGECLPGVIHCATRALGTHSQTIYPDHQDAMAIRNTGWCMLASSSVQEAMDLALVSHLTAMDCSLPFFHFFDGFRTSHEIMKIKEIPQEDVAKMVDHDAIERFRASCASPAHPEVRGAITGYETYFQSSEAINPLYNAVPASCQKMMDKVASYTGRQYHTMDYHGAPDAERVIVVMGSAAGAAAEAVDFLTARGEKVGVVNVRLFRPFDVEKIRDVIPATCKRVAVLDRTKETGAAGEPLFLDVCSAFASVPERGIQVIGGRYGLGGKEFSPTTAAGVFDNLALETPKTRFTVGINDDVTHLSIPTPERIDAVPEGTVQCMFWGLGADGTVGANKTAIKIIGNNTDLSAQGYFVYDAKKSGGLTVSHLRFGPQEIKSSYLIDNADYIACHNPAFLNIYKHKLVEPIKEGGSFVVNGRFSNVDEFGAAIDARTKRILARRHAKVYAIDAEHIAREVGLGSRINMVMQTVFFGLANVIPMEHAISLLKKEIEKTYGRKGKDIVEMNWKAVDASMAAIKPLPIPEEWANVEVERQEIDWSRPDFVRNFMDRVNTQTANELPVSAMPYAGRYPVSTTQYEKRAISTRIPEWNMEACSQCNTCAMVCPHAVIRPYLVDDKAYENRPFDSALPKAKGKKFKGLRFMIQPSPLDCTGCGVCAETCPDDALRMVDIAPVRDANVEKYEWAHALPLREELMDKFSVKGSQFQQPLLEFSGACPGCAETPVVRLVTQLYGKRMTISNASGCSVVWSATAGPSPYTTDGEGHGPTYANSLFEDGAEFGAGHVFAYTQRREKLMLEADKVLACKCDIPADLRSALEAWRASAEDGEQTAKTAPALIAALADESRYAKATCLESLKYLKMDQDMLVKPSVWIMGGDGWAEDIGFAGIDHIVASGVDCNMLVFDNGVYANTGGQKSKATPLGAVQNFARNGQEHARKDLAAMMMTYGDVYVASVSLSDPKHLLNCIKEAEAFHGPSLLVYNSPCINWGIKGGMTQMVNQSKLMVDSGMWNLWSYDPRRGENMQDKVVISSEPDFEKVPLVLESQVRFQSLSEARKAELHPKLIQDLKTKWANLNNLRK